MWYIEIMRVYVAIKKGNYVFVGNGFNIMLSETKTETNIKLSFTCGIQIEIYNYMTNIIYNYIIIK